MRRWGLVFVLLIYFPLIFNAKSQNISNEGTDFWAVFPTHDPSYDNGGIPSTAEINIWITSKFDSKVTVSYGNFTSESISVFANVPKSYPVPRDQVYIGFEERNRNISNRGIHIQVVPGQPKVAVYAHIYAGARSAASLILPQESLGQEYFSMNYEQDLDNSRNNRNFLTLVATEPNTDLIIHARNGISIPVKFINAGDVYQYMPTGTEDLTGTSVEIDRNSPDNCTKRFAAFSGSTSVTIGCTGSRDPLFQQLYPTTSWGKSYSIIPFKDRYYRFRVLAQEDNTLITVGNNPIPERRNRGEYYESSARISEPLFISADKKISVAQYSLTQPCSGISSLKIGDPDMVLLNPVEFNIKAITLFSSDLQDIKEKYINVSIKTKARNTFKINGQPPSADEWKTIPSNPELSYIQLQIYNKSSTLTANEGFNAIAYGFGEFESYAYSAGTNLAANNYLLISNSVTNTDALNACILQESDFKIVLPYEATKLTWALDNEAIFDDPLNPNQIIGAGGDVLYEYVYDRNKIFPDTGKHNMVVVATMPNTDGCLGRPLEYPFMFDVYPIPTASFTAVDEICFDAEVSFMENSNSNLPGKPINKWQWDFGDGELSTEQDPKHAYKTSGEFEIRFSAGVDEGCMSDVFTKKITVRPEIIPDFTVKAINCIGSHVEFTDISTVEENKGTISSWQWNFGDGATSTEQNPGHTYAAAGSYEVTLIAGTANHCVSAPKKISITVKGLPLANFSMPEICSEDITAEFTNLSTDADRSSTAGLSYIWDFGDTGNPQNSSADLNAKHNYPRAGDYTVTLTVVTADGCSSTTSQLFTVNGSAITAKFDVVNKDNLCSSNNVIVKNTSTVNSGKITKVVWIKDAARPAETLTDDEPEPGGSYEFTYSPAVSPIPATYTIIMQAYSGINCVEEHRQTITIYPRPDIVFDPIPSLCVNTGVFKMEQAREILGVKGTPTYRGPGVSPDGIFNPEQAGVGTHTISYAFVSDNGCDAVKTQTITVYPIPAASFTRDVFIYAGGQKQLDLEASGAGLTFKWEPSVNLDRDNVQNPVVTADEERIYTVTISSSQGCAITEKFFVHVIPEIETSNAFSPNGDGINDTWIIKNIETYPDATVEIFNRYGERVYYSKGFYKPFDGNYKDQPLPVGTYYYLINPNNGRKIVTSSLTLIR